MKYPFDPDVRALVATRLYEMLPELYRVEDQPPRGETALEGFIDVLAAPLAVVHQNIQELHADFFIDFCNDWVIPYLADMVGTTLVFPDALSNRKDVRGTATWRRKKGTPAMLQELASELSGKPVVTVEGWKRLQMAQDLNLLRAERVTPDIRDPLLHETSSGPLDATFHAADLRTASPNTGRYHPRQITHWMHPTRYFPVRASTPAPWASQPGRFAGTADHRFTFHPLGEMVALGARRTDTPIATDKVPPIHFKVSPADYFGNAQSYFDVQICGLSAAVADRSATTRASDNRAADPALGLAGGATSLLDVSSNRLSGEIEVQLCALDMDSNTNTPVPGSIAVRSGFLLTGNGAAPMATPTVATAIAQPLSVIKLVTSSGTREYFPGCVIEVSGPALGGARRASTSAALATEGFLRGALVVELPAMYVDTSKFLYVAADGSVYAAVSGGAYIPLSPHDGWYRLPGEALAVGPGPAWPPTGASASSQRLTRVPTAPHRGPAFMHGGHALKHVSGTNHTPIPASVESSLVLAAYRVDSGQDDYHPFARLVWSGHDVSTATWNATAGDGTDSSLAPEKRFADIAALRDEVSLQLSLHVRLESDDDNVILPPCEVAITTDEGDAILLHIPELTTSAVPAGNTWPTPRANVSSAYKVLDDGSTQVAKSSQLGRYSLGNIAPLSEHATLRRRQVAYRKLCPWDNETVVDKHRPTAPGMLDIDPGFGLFALAKSDAITEFADYSTGTGMLAPVPATPNPLNVSYQEGYTDHTGARPAPREPELDALQPTPTRLVVGGGALHPDATVSFFGIPMYDSLGAALLAIDVDGANGEAATDEVIQLEDSTTYTEELPLWPRGPTTLTIQAAENARPTVHFSSTLSATQHTGLALRELTLRGLQLANSPSGAIPAMVTLPPLSGLTVQYCTAANTKTALGIQAADKGLSAEIVRCVLAKVVVTGAGALAIFDSVIDGGSTAAFALSAPDAGLELERVTVNGRTESMTLHASEIIFTGVLAVKDRFHGCIRYSRILAGSDTPRRHRVTVFDSTIASEPDVAVISWDRVSPAHARLSARTDDAVRRGAEDGSEMGAFSGLATAQRYEGLMRRLEEYTPAGLLTGTIRVD